MPIVKLCQTPTAARLALLVAFFLVSTGRADADDKDEPPPAGRPADFSGAVGIFDRVTMTAQPTALQAVDPLTLTLRITAAAPVKRPPRRPDLHKLPAFADQFYIEDLPDPPRPPSAPLVWEFSYRLKPRTDQVKVIPALAFTYFDPDFLKPNMPFPARGYQTLYADDEIPLRVRPRERVQPGDVRVSKEPLPGPEALYQLAEGPAVLRRQEAASARDLVFAGCLLLTPPALCLTWYVLWRRRHPDAARLTRQRRSRAAQKVLQALAALGKDGQQAQRSAAVVTAYLHQRLDLAAAEPTPREAATHLSRLGLPDELTERARHFFQACDVARFAPAADATSADLPAVARDLILALETFAFASTSGAANRTRARRGGRIVAGVCLVLASLGAAPSAADLDRAEAHFREGVRLRDQPPEARKCFREAAAAYESLRQQGASNADLLRNQGNAYLLAGDLPQAIRAYRRGLRLAPDDRALQANLTYARDQVVYPPTSVGRPPDDFWPLWLTRWVLRLCTGLALILYSLGWLSLTRWWLTRRGQLLSYSGAAFAVALLMGALPAAVWLIEARQAQQNERQPLVVINEDGVYLRRGNGTSYPPVQEAPLNRGLEGRRLFTRGDWLQIELTGGEVGWVRRDQVLVDEL